MSHLLYADFLHYLFGILMFLTALFLILLILVQRGRGGGLTGALGGMGGQSAFGTKAGDLFTRVTMVAAAVWILLCIAAIKLLNESSTGMFGGTSSRPNRVEGAGKDKKSDGKADSTKSGETSGDSEAVTGENAGLGGDTKDSTGAAGGSAAEAAPTAESPKGASTKPGDATTPTAEAPATPPADSKSDEKK